MSELRWILLGAGVALILGLWWWETRRARLSGDSSGTWPAVRSEPTVGGDAEDAGNQAVTPAAFQPTIERLRAPRRPPLVEIPDDIEVDVSAYVTRDRRRVPERERAVPLPKEDVPQTDDDAGVAGEPDADHRAPWVRTQPLEKSEVAPKRDSSGGAPPHEPQRSSSIEQHAAEASKQRIVALRLIAPDARWDGKHLREAIEAEGLRYGKYSIFHRTREDGRSLFYVASMMEPGSFDIAKMDGQLFPGISLFGIVPGPVDAPGTFDMVLAAGRQLAERLHGQLQDEQGSTLTAQRIRNLREELVHFEHRTKRLRRT